jgi:hypothetical protein
MNTATVAAKPAKQPKPLPAPNSDFYGRTQRRGSRATRVQRERNRGVARERRGTANRLEFNQKES